MKEIYKKVIVMELPVRNAVVITISMTFTAIIIWLVSM